MRKRMSHVWEKDPKGWYVEPQWCSRRLFEVEKFKGVHDPACGIGTITTAAQAFNIRTTGADIVRRRRTFAYTFTKENFLKRTKKLTSDVVCNPPFDYVEEFCRHSLELGAKKVAMITLVRRLNAAHWLQELPLTKVYLLSPRPSMPPGSWLAQGNSPGGGTQDFAWLIFEAGKKGEPLLRWLHRDD